MGRHFISSVNQLLIPQIGLTVLFQCGFCSGKPSAADRNIDTVDHDKTLQIPVNAFHKGKIDDIAFVRAEKTAVRKLCDQIGKLTIYN